MRQDVRLLRKMRIVASLLTVIVAGSTLAVEAAEGLCPVQMDSGALPSMETLRNWNAFVAVLGVRPTASPANEAYIDWVEQKMRGIPGVEPMVTYPLTVDRWLEREVTLAVGSDAQSLADVPVAAAVPYAQVTTGVTAPLVFVPSATAISSADVGGKIVVRDVVPGSVPNAVFTALSYVTYDPDVTLLPTDNYERDWLSNDQRIQDLLQAKEAGAAAVLFIQPFPRDQVRGYYAPYEGYFWGVPALYLGVDEGDAIKEKLAAGQPLVGSITLAADRETASTRSITFTLPGASPERIVIASHTDGTNALEDNGPVAIVALAQAFAQLPAECRPRTIEFGFTAAHFYQSTGTGAGRYANILDGEYGEGKVAFVIAIEHLGAREYARKARIGTPGDELAQTGLSEPLGWFVSESPALVGASIAAIVGRDLKRTTVLRGADLPGAHVPPHCSYGGEGGPYHDHLLPTIALISGPWFLFDPAFGIEAIDSSLMRAQTLAIGDVVLSVASLPREVIAGADTVYRPLRDAGSPGCPLIYPWRPE